MKRISGFFLSAGLMFGIAGTASALPNLVYSNNFSSGAGSAWTNGSIANDQGLGPYLGNFSMGNGSTLTLTGLSAHTQVSLQFDLYTMASWDGSDSYWGPDSFSLSGDVAGSWTFSNFGPNGGDSYPGMPDEGSGGWGYYAYRNLDPTGTGNEFLVNHTGSTFTVAFGGPTNQTDEWWGIDNVRVSIDHAQTNTVPEPETYAMLLAGLGLLGLSRRKKQNA